jgi:hypothetical protein
MLTVIYITKASWLWRKWLRPDSSVHLSYLFMKSGTDITDSNSIPEAKVSGDIPAINNVNRKY